MVRDEVLSLVKEVLSEILDSDDLIIGENIKIDELENWDSLNFVKMVLALESELKIRIMASELYEISTVGELVNLCLSKSG
mgnify:CR=1 FL=1